MKNATSHYIHTGYDRGNRPAPGLGACTALACRRGVAALLIVLATLATGRSARAATAGHSRPAATVEQDVQSDYSHIRVKRQGNVRSLVFVRDSGEEALESSVNLSRPYELLVPYTRFMFASYLFQPKQREVLIVGLGGGAMVHFYRHYDPEVHVEAVEIDPAVVDLADRYFSVRAEKNVRIVTADGLRHVRETKTRYDVIYMDAFLKPSRETDRTGAPLRQKTVEFYKGLQEKLAASGVAVVNLNQHAGTQDDLALLRAAFAETYVFRVPGGNFVVIGSPAEPRLDAAALRQRAAEADRRLKATFSFAEMLSALGR
jgi:spermidine synthase